MSAAADLDALIASFGQYGDLITTGDTVDQMQRVIVALSDSTLNPPNDNLGNDSMVWLCKLLKYLSNKQCPNVGPELIPAGAVYVDNGSGAGVYHLATPNGEYLITSPVPSNSGQVIADTLTGGARLTFSGVASITGFANPITVNVTSGAIYLFGGNIGGPVLYSVKALL
jgi:hypothetical protein